MAKYKKQPRKKKTAGRKAGKQCQTPDLGAPDFEITEKLTSYLESLIAQQNILQAKIDKANDI